MRFGMRTSCRARQLTPAFREHGESGADVGWEQWTAQAVPGDNWGSQVVQVNAPLTGDGTTGNELGLDIDPTTLSLNALNQLTANKRRCDLECGPVAGHGN
jgi:hypothetical protein